jgi:hypothetical protein
MRDVRMQSTVAAVVIGVPVAVGAGAYVRRLAVGR